MKFTPGLQLNRNFYSEILKPLLKSKFPNLNYSAALLGFGSDVVGFDNVTSMDHGWGPRCYIFLSKHNMNLKDHIDDFLKYNLPFEFKGYPTNYSDPNTEFVTQMKETNSYPINHLIEIHDIEGYFEYLLSIKSINSLKTTDWINFQDQILIELTNGEIFYDGLNKLESIRTKLNFYPTDVLKIRLASLWSSIWNEEPFIGRCIEMEDYIGLKIIIPRIVSTLIKILFYLEKEYIPYSKWFGTSFKKLKSYRTTFKQIEEILNETDTYKIANQLCELFKAVLEIHNRIEDLPHLDNEIKYFFNRPYKVIFADSIVDKLINSIGEKEIKEKSLNTIALDIKLESIDFTD